MLPCWIDTVQGTRFFLGNDPIDDRILEHVYHAAVDLYFPPEIAPPPDSLLLDVGAHHGIYSVEALRRYPGTRLIAIEPDPQACATLERNLAANGMLERAEIVQAGIGAESGEAILEYSTQGSWGTRTRPVTSNSAAIDSSAPRVRMRRIDEVLQGRAPALVKCSAEGAEFAVFPQMFALGLRPDWVVLFAHPEVASVSELMALFTQAGYEYRDADSPPAHARYHCRYFSGGRINESAPAC